MNYPLLNIFSEKQSLWKQRLNVFILKVKGGLKDE